MKDIETWMFASFEAKLIKNLVERRAFTENAEKKIHLYLTRGSQKVKKLMNTRV
jgi:hypothetical protein